MDSYVFSMQQKKLNINSKKIMEIFQNEDYFFTPYRYMFIKSYLVTDGFNVEDDKDILVKKIENGIYLLSQNSNKDEWASVGFLYDNVFLLFSLAEDKKISYNVKNAIDGIIPLQFSKTNMYNLILKKHDNVALWEYRAKKSKEQSYFKDETDEKTDLYKRIRQDSEIGLKPYMSTFKVDSYSKESSFTINGDGFASCTAEFFPRIAEQMLKLFSDIVEKESTQMQFVTKIRLERKYENIPYLSTGTKIVLASNFDIKNFKNMAKRHNIQVINADDSKIKKQYTIYEYNLKDYVSLTTFSRAIYVYPRSLSNSKQENIVANLRYILDELFGLSVLS